MTGTTVRGDTLTGFAARRRPCAHDRTGSRTGESGGGPADPDAEPRPSGRVAVHADD
ncbi:hypothetical protein ACIQCR_25405 [Streptomyces sp. NPDC093249]|uniref:hypothetical protein n=1 Tax=unclassified Streptomyces TaxID=2593676 RepID=UPI003821473A